MTYMQTEKNELKHYLKQSGNAALASMEEVNQKRIMGALMQRQSDALDVLDFVKAEAQMPYDGTEAPQKKDPLGNLIGSPMLTILLSLGAIVFVFLSILSSRAPQTDGTVSNTASMNWLYALLLLVLVLGQGVFRLVRQAKAGTENRKEPTAEPILDVDRAKVQMEKQVSRLINDSEAICGVFQNQQLDGVNAYEDELVKLYTSLYEAKVDRPECEEFNYSLTMAEMMLRKIGLKTVPYSDNQRKLFNVEREDYHDEMRFPAIVREKTGELIKQGEYIQNIHDPQ